MRVASGWIAGDSKKQKNPRKKKWHFLRRPSISRHAREFFAPGVSPAHVAFRDAAVKAGLNVDTLREILAVTNADCDLIAFGPTCANLIEIIEIIESVWQVDPSNWSLDTWIPVLSWVSANRQQLKAYPDLGAKFDPENRKLFPHIGHGVQRHPFYAMLWFTHAHPAFRERYRLAQAQLLAGIIQALHNKYRTAAAWASMIRAYESYSGREEWKPLENSVQGISMLGCRLSSSTEAYLEYLKWLPVERAPGEFIEAFFTSGYPTDLLNHNKLLAARHISLRRFLDKVSGRRRFQSRTRPIFDERFRGHVKREMREIGNGLVGKELTYLDSLAIRTWKSPVIHYTRCVKRSPVEIKEALDADDDPFAEEDSTEDIFTIQPPVNKGRNVSFSGWSQLRPIIMANHLLPYSFSNLAPAEAKALLSEAERWLADHSSADMTNREMARLEILTFALTMLTTGSSRAEGAWISDFPCGQRKQACRSIAAPTGPPRHDGYLAHCIHRPALPLSS